MKKLLFLLWCLVNSQMLMAKTVGPLIQTQWDQGYPYNLMCPEINGQHCMTSCGATAMAQICYYYRWPEHGMGRGSWHINGGDWHNPDLTGDYYDYNKMLLTYDENSSEESKMAVALLMRDVAYLGAVFDINNSYSPSDGELVNNFGYDKGMMHLESGYFSQTDLISIIRSELDAGRPVLLGGSNGIVGHAFICDGYNNEGQFHFNYGWGGNSDGWSTLENCVYPLSMDITYNIKKDEGGLPGFTISSNRDFKWIGGNKLYGNYKFNCNFTLGLQPQIALAVENTTTHDVQYYFHHDTEVGNSSDVELLWQLDVDLPDGSYTLYPVGRSKVLNTQWKKCFFRDLCQHEVLLTVNNGVKTFDNATLIDPVKDDAVDVDGLCYVLDTNTSSATLTYRNDKYACYDGDIVVPEQITIGNDTYTVTSIGDETFRECSYLGNVTIAKTVKTIGMSAFYNSTAKKIVFDEGSQLETIEGYAFYCGNFEEVILPEGLEIIGDVAFANTNMKSVTIPSTITYWGENCFATTSLKCVRINSNNPPNIPQCFRTNTDDADFAYFDNSGAYGTQASVLYVPSGTKTAYEQANVWKNFGFILEPGDNDDFVEQITRDAIEVDGIVYQINGVKNIARASGIKDGVKNVIIRNNLPMGSKTLNVTILNYYFLEPNKEYESVIIPASVETLEMFSVCSKINSLTFEENSHLTTIKEVGFGGAEIPVVVIPEGVKTLGRMDLTVSELTIPSTVVTLESNNYIRGLRHCRVSWSTPPIVSNLFYADGLENATLHVPDGTKSLYAAAEGWNLFPNIIEGEEPATYTVLDETSTVAPVTENGVNVRVKRSIKADSWSTICLPFAISAEKLTAAFGEGVQVKDFSSWSSTMDGTTGNIVGITIGFSSVTAMEANHPYLIKVTNAITAENGFTVDDVDIVPEDEPTKQVGTNNANRGLFIGTYVANTTVPENDLFISNDRFYYSNGSTKMKAFRGYFELADVLTSVEGAASRIMISDETTGIADVRSEMSEGKDLYYSIAGQKVENPQKGLYIKNGKKVIIK